MSERHTNESSHQRRTMKRRGILAAAGAALAGFAAKQTAQPASADGGTWTLPYLGILDDFDRAIVRVFNDNYGGAIYAESTYGHGLHGRSDLSKGVYGESINGYGIYGTCGGSNAAVYGENTSSGKGVHGTAPGGGWGVYGESTTGYGVYGNAPQGFGVVASSDAGTGCYVISQKNSGLFAQSFGANYASVNARKETGPAPAVLGQVMNTASAANTVAVTGLNQSTGTGGIGVIGRCDTITGIGVQGQSDSGVGVFGVSNGNAGVLGISNAPGNVGIGGIANVSGTAAFAGTSTNPNAFAGFFTGDVFVNGNFTVNDPTRKHGAIQHPDGSLRLLYSMESPESWLEDFGTGHLVGGKMEVRLDPDFAAVVQMGEYHVFLTAYDGACKGLAVTARRSDRFTVQELNGGTSGGAFSYRVVAKPKSEHKAARMAKFVVPEIKVPQPPPMPSASAGKVPDVPPQAAPPPRPASSTAAPQGSGTVPASTTSPVQPIPPPRP